MFVGGALESRIAAVRGGLREQQKPIWVHFSGMWRRITNGFILCHGAGILGAAETVVRCSEAKRTEELRQWKNLKRRMVGHKAS
jgi:hypothetical protein